jgi:hypothetical protein
MGFFRHNFSAVLNLQILHTTLLSSGDRATRYDLHSNLFYLASIDVNPFLKLSVSVIPNYFIANLPLGCTRFPSQYHMKANNAGSRLS